MIENKVALVTGVSSGIGREIAQLLAERGARVFGTVRDHRSTASLTGVELMQMDVTNDASVAEAVQSLLLRRRRNPRAGQQCGIRPAGRIGGDEPFGSPSAVRYQFLWCPSGDAGRPALNGWVTAALSTSARSWVSSRGPTWAFTPPANMRWRATPRRWISEGRNIRHPGCAGRTRFQRKPTSGGTARPPCPRWMLMRIKENESRRSFGKKSPVETSREPWPR